MKLAIRCPLNKTKKKNKFQLNSLLDAEMGHRVLEGIE